MLERQAVEAKARTPMPGLPEDLEEYSLPVPVQVDEAGPVMRTPQPSQRVPTRRQPSRQPHPGQQTGGPVAARRGSLVAALFGVAFAILGVALVLGLFVASEVDDGGEIIEEPATTIVFEEEVVEIPLIIEVINRDGFYLSPGIIDPRNEVGEAVQRAQANGVGFAAVVLVEDWPEPSAIAGEIESSVGQETVLVLTATQAGISSSVYDSDVMNAALNAGSEAFAEGGDPAYVRAVVDLLIAVG